MHIFNQAATVFQADAAGPLIAVKIGLHIGAVHGQVRNFHFGLSHRDNRQSVIAVKTVREELLTDIVGQRFRRDLHRAAIPADAAQRQVLVDKDIFLIRAGFNIDPAVGFHDINRQLHAVIVVKHGHFRRRGNPEIQRRLGRQII